MHEVHASTPSSRAWERATTIWAWSSPPVVTQEIAIRASFQETPYGPEAVDLVECHGTSTRQGDVEEVRALKSFFNASKRTVLTSFKSQIGHTLGASGINSLIRGVMAMKAGVFPPTLNYQHPDPAIDLKGSGLFIAPEPLDWESKAGQLRRLQVNAFGFGGSNYVVQLEQAMDEAGTILVSPGSAPGLAREKAGTTADLPEKPNSARRGKWWASRTSGRLFLPGQDGRLRLPDGCGGGIRTRGAHDYRKVPPPDRGWSRHPQGPAIPGAAGDLHGHGGSARTTAGFGVSGAGNLL